MAKQPLEITSWVGGQSTDLKMGQELSFAYSRHIDFRKRASAISILPRTVEDTVGIIQGLPLNMVQVNDENLYVGDQFGNVYLFDAASWSQLPGNMDTFQYGMAYIRQMDRLLLTNNETISTVKNAGYIFGTPTLEVDTLGPSRDIFADVTGFTYSSQAAVDEGVTHRKSWSPRTEPFSSNKLLVAVKGTGNIRVTLHDAENNELDSVLVLNATLVNGQWIEWDFTGRPRMNIGGAFYHVHVTHEGGTATTFTSSVANDAETLAFQTFSSRLINDLVAHPIIEFLNFYCIANERYLSVWEPITINPTDQEYLRHRLIFPSGRQITSMAIWGDMLAIATGKYSTLSQSLEDGKIYFWGGTSKTYDNTLDVPGGAPQALYSQLNRLYWDVGGKIQTWAGGDIEDVWTFPNSDTEFKNLDGATFVTPYMMAVRQGILMNAWPNSTYDDTIEFGVYSFGARDRSYPYSAGYSYTSSNGTRSHAVPNVSLTQLGMLKQFGNDLFIGWADYDGGVTYGLDKVSPDNPPFAEAELHSLIIDNGRVRKDKQAAELYMTFEALPAGATVTPMYRIDRAASWTEGAPAVAGDTEVLLNINKRYKEIQLGVKLTATVTTPIVTGAEFIWDTNETERD